ncbi:MAG: SDR family NAD(P)-dependent oxidoreductase [Propionicimonas sp.]|uniref:SDR family NAD(P)-dependent oxidoreductase n=1 Tax=Propionicimonas sp. TaxID=1955623 RepID=UPI002B20020B|nr:SDR family NAD(P)-dependent oxidoreductase [Propionicimonas sp.]MEA4944601.1 SDR family NAD(P)-dependent oxidoreductase [Propionicimonas sp.]
MDLTQELIEVANAFGDDPEFSRAGGGNASVKQDGVLAIKPSGVPLATLTADDLVPLKLDVLLAALHSDEPVDGDPVRAAAQRAALPHPSGRRPSVEILFHALIPDALVLHCHPLVGNALTCNHDAESLAAALLGDDAIVVPYIDPGVPLARGVEAARTAYTERTGRPAPAITLLRNHGIIVSGNSAAEITERVNHLTAVIRTAVDATETPAVPELDQAELVRVRNAIAPALRGLLGTDEALAVVTSAADDLVRSVTASPAGEALLTGGPLIPDQIVYAGSLPAVVDLDSDPDPARAAVAALETFRSRHGKDPVIVVVPGLVTFGAGKDLTAAQTALATFTDALRVARDADRIGSVQVMDAAERGFIENWEAEAYRKQIAAGASGGRLDGKVVMITGAAQGFGLGIAQELITQGATLVLSDLNLAGAQAAADDLAARHGVGRAVAVRIDVSNEQSCLDAVAETVALLGGVDVFISNAGVARAGSVFTQQVADFDLVTNVNYRGYFLTVRAVAPVLAAQHAVRPGQWFDIIEVNSKSGLQGSKANFAYAGSKFGGIGLTQSFALELVTSGIKVNAICPGNYLDGPLWSDPERGLFVQYLHAGKVPGATTVQQVREHYMKQVPMGRGCFPADLAKTIYYIVEQDYETGQAIPVTGGQNMLN